MTIEEDNLLSPDNVRAQAAAAAPDSPDDDFIDHICVSVYMAVFFLCYACSIVWQEEGHHWYEALIAAVAFSYSTAMMHLRIIRRWENRMLKGREELEAPKGIIIITPAGGMQMTSVWMLLATGIMVASLGATIFVFQPDRDDLANIAYFISLSTAATMYLQLISGEHGREKREEAPDLA